MRAADCEHSQMAEQVKNVIKKQGPYSIQDIIVGRLGAFAMDCLQPGLMLSSHGNSS